MAASARGRVPPDSTHVSAKIRAKSRLVSVGESLLAALNCLAVVAPDWLLEHSSREWVKRYGHRVEGTQFPTGQAEQQAAEVIEQDGAALLSALFDPYAPKWFSHLPAVETLLRV